MKFGFCNSHVMRTCRESASQSRTDKVGIANGEVRQTVAKTSQKISTRIKSKNSRALQTVGTYIVDILVGASVVIEAALVHELVLSERLFTANQHGKGRAQQRCRNLLPSWHVDGVLDAAYFPPHVTLQAQLVRTPR
jgi:hypothetical protein